MIEPILTGTWEEVSQYAEDLAGKRVCVSILSETTAEKSAAGEQTQAILRRIMARQAGAREPAPFVLALPRRHTQTLIEEIFPNESQEPND